jgi:diguanylate cyclase (GGDEF)-like protein
MLPEPPQPQKPPAVPQARRVSDAQPAPARATPPVSAAQAHMPVASGLPAALDSLQTASGLDKLPPHWMGVVLGASTAAVAAGAALLFTNGLGWSATAGAVGAALLAVSAAAVPALAMARRAAPAPAAPLALPPGQRPGVTSKALFLELIEREWARARRYGTGAALVLVDLDRHVQLSDTHGPGALDTVLAELARQTATTLRGADAIARFGPSQLAVFLAHADPMGALDVAERIRERAEFLQVDPQGEPMRLSVSLGVAQLRPAHLHLQALLHDAEDAVFAARQAGGNCVRAAPVDVSGRNSHTGWRNDQRTRPQ